ncbi:hypothetical protein JCM24511_09325 [Saitozyma sp. JCM 24511]|nr:hypothetical protein JCM24511_09325 [Saitozyma sp. JCM 24511]
MPSVEMSIMSAPVDMVGREAYVNPSKSKSKSNHTSALASAWVNVDKLTGWLKPWPRDTPDDILRHELKTKGVVHIKQAMPRGYVLGIRERFFERVAPSGVLKSGTDPVDGIFCGGDPENFVWPKVLPGDNGQVNSMTLDDMAKQGDYTYLAAQVHFEDWTNAFAGNEHLIGLVSRFEPSWTRPICLRRQIFRTNMPNAKSATGVHYDQLFLRHGPPTAITAWIPIGDCPPQGGGLMYLDDSLVLGRELEEGFTRLSEERNFTDDERKSAYNSNMTAKGGLGNDAGVFARSRANGRKWLIGDYEAGDAVFHHMYAIHASGLNHDPHGRIRFSADVRYVDGDQAYDRRWTKWGRPIAERNDH